VEALDDVIDAERGGVEVEEGCERCSKSDDVGELGWIDSDEIFTPDAVESSDAERSWVCECFSLSRGMAVNLQWLERVKLSYRQRC
jgi:hypothetical protein